jgi:hypothetical protein
LTRLTLPPRDWPATAALHLGRQQLKRGSRLCAFAVKAPTITGGVFLTSSRGGGEHQRETYHRASFEESDYDG